MSGLDKVSKKVNACVTCEYWKGEVRQTTPDRLFVVYESYQRGACMGPLKTGQSMTPLNKCKAWRIWAHLKKPKDTDESIFGEQSATWWEGDDTSTFYATREASEGLKPSSYVQELLDEREEQGKSPAEVQEKSPDEVQEKNPDEVQAQNPAEVQDETSAEGQSDHQAQ